VGPVPPFYALQSHVLHPTSSRGLREHSRSLATHCSLYTLGVALRDSEPSCALHRAPVLRISHAAVTQDPFQHGLDRNADTGKNNPLMVTESTGSETAGQVIAYTTLILSTQYRTHTFSVLIINDYAQLIRWDHSGAIVTEPIYYNDQSYLFDFLVCYNHASNEACGHDPTVGPPADHKAQAARTIKELSEANSLLSVTIQGSQPQGSCRFIIGTPCRQPDIPAGCWT